MKKKWLSNDGKELIQAITEKHLDPQRRCDKFFNYNLMVVLAFYLETRSIGIENTRIESIGEGKLVDVRAVHDLFFDTILPEILTPKRTCAEADAIVMTIFEETLESISAPLYAKMSSIYD